MSLVTCAVCGATIGEIAEPDISEQQLSLCDECEADQVAPIEAWEPPDELIVDLSPGVERVEHCCALLLYSGDDEQEATFPIVLEAGVEEGFLIGKCDECCTIFRSALVAKPGAG